MEPNVSKSQLRQELRSRWAEQAVQAALRGEWDEAVQRNLQILEMFPQDVKARNRLGKAYLELGEYEQAAATYEENLEKQPSNAIARRRLTELYALVEREPVTVLETGGDVDEFEETEDEPDDPVDDDIDPDGGED